MAETAKKFVTLALVSVIFTKVKEYVTKSIAAIPGLSKASATVLGGIMIGDGLKVDAAGKASVDFTKANTYADTKVKAAVDEIRGGASDALDTFKELEQWIGEHQDAVDLMNNAIGSKANKTEVYSKTDADSTFIKTVDITEATEADINEAATAVFGAAA